MSRGAACIGSTWGGIPELIPPERLHVPGDVSGLAKLIRSLVTEPDALADAAFQDLETSAAFEPSRLAAVRSSFFNDLRERAEKGKP